MMLEQQKYSPNGFQFTRGPGNYKIPGFGDVPVEFNVSLLKGSVNERAVYSSKVRPCKVLATNTNILEDIFFYNFFYNFTEETLFCKNKCKTYREYQSL